MKCFNKKLLIFIVPFSLAFCSPTNKASTGSDAGSHMGSDAGSDASNTTPSSKWVQTWGNAPAYVSDSYQNKTVRIIIRTSIGGSQLRVRLTNAFNTAPLQVNEAHIALTTSNDSINPLSDQTLTFSGSKSVTIPAGGEPLYSDPVNFTVPSLTQLSVSLYFAQNTGAVTTHPLGQINSYFAPGNLTGSANLGGSPQITTTAPVLDGLDVMAPESSKLVVAFGDSITDGSYSTTGAFTTWPDILANNLVNAQASGSQKISIAVANSGIGGNQVLLDSDPTSGSGISGLHRFSNDALTRPGVTDIIVLEGINDLGINYSTITVSDLTTGYTQMINMAHAAGLKIFFGTLTPIRDSNNDTPAYLYGSDATFYSVEPLREAVNQWIRTTNLHDGYIDFEAAVSSSPGSNRWNPSLCYTRDQIHGDDAGYTVMGNAIPLTLFY